MRHVPLILCVLFSVLVFGTILFYKKYSLSLVEVNGTSGLKDDTGGVRRNGVKVPSCIRGDTGPSGIKGARGDTGPSGVKGARVNIGTSDIKYNIGPSSGVRRNGVKVPSCTRDDAGPADVRVPSGVRCDVGVRGGPAGAKGDAGGPSDIKYNTDPPGVRRTGVKVPSCIRGDTGPSGVKGARVNIGTSDIKYNTGPPGVVNVPSCIRGDAGPADVRVNIGSSGVKCDMVGIRGPVGAKGDTGQVGAKGPSGVNGDTGPAGVRGDTGPAGVRGLVGPVGAKGDTGQVGAKGPSGVNGDTGPAGVRGDTGPAGVRGLVGPVGAKGDTGQVGVKGPSGVNGNTGPAGVRGLVGTRGPVGVKGDTGPAGTCLCNTLSNVTDMKFIICDSLLKYIDVFVDDVPIDGNVAEITFLPTHNVIKFTINNIAQANFKKWNFDGNGYVSIDGNTLCYDLRFITSKQYSIYPVFNYGFILESSTCPFSAWGNIATEMDSYTTTTNYDSVEVGIKVSYCAPYKFVGWEGAGVTSKEEEEAITLTLSPTTPYTIYKITARFEYVFKNKIELQAAIREWFTHMHNNSIEKKYGQIENWTGTYNIIDFSGMFINDNLLPYDLSWMSELNWSFENATNMDNFLQENNMYTGNSNSWKIPNGYVLNENMNGIKSIHTI